MNHISVGFEKDMRRSFDDLKNSNLISNIWKIYNINYFINNDL